MAKDEQLSGIRISNAIAAQRQSKGTIDRSSLADTLVKSPQWKENTLRGIKALQSGDSQDTAPQETCACTLHEPGSGQEALALRTDEVEQLRQTIVKLEAENARRAEEHQAEVETIKAELLGIKAAYDQFEQQSDLLVNELDEQNERLRAECKHQNRLSIL